MSNPQNHLNELIELAQQASDAIMDIYNDEKTIVTIKQDGSPLTQADHASHDILVNGLERLFPDIPVVSEEGDDELNSRLVSGDRFWLVDPIDGTKEFINRTGEFTVCIGLIEDGKPTYGIVAAAALSTIYYGGPATGSFKINPDGTHHPIHVAEQPTNVVMASVSHKENATANYIAAHYPDADIQARGSQLKFLAVAEGAADAYPRIDHTMRLWDVASGHAIVEGAGGSVTRPDGSAIDYNTPTLLVGDFVARSNTNN